MFAKFIFRNKQVFFSFFIKILAILINSLFLISLAKYLKVTEFGNFQLLMNVSIFLTTFLTLGLDHKLFSESSKEIGVKYKKNSGKYFNCIAYINLFVLLVLILLISSVFFINDSHIFSIKKDVIYLYIFSINETQFRRHEKNHRHRK